MDTISHIERIRAQNNRNWIAILRLAFKTSPKEAKAIMAEISKLDKQITKLMQRLGHEQ